LKDRKPSLTNIIKLKSPMVAQGQACVLWSQFKQPTYPIYCIGVDSWKL